MRKWSLKLSKVLINEFILEKGQIIICLMNNSIYYPIIFLGAAQIGCVLTGVSPDYSKGIFCFKLAKIKEF